MRARALASCATASPTLFRWPAGLADGLARKEPAPPVDHHGISPKQPGSPALRNDPEIRRYVSIGSRQVRLERFVEPATSWEVSVVAAAPFCPYQPHPRGGWVEKAHYVYAKSTHPLVLGGSVRHT